MEENIKFLDIDIYEITKAARIIKQGNLVAFPTETVYGLGVAESLPRSINRT